MELTEEKDAISPRPSVKGRASSIFSSPDTSKTGHLYAIDFARGLAALIVLLWHYQHFFLKIPGSEFPKAARSIQPLYSIFWPFYEYGQYAVEFFWMISGFVFAAVYITKPATTREFVVNRFARLYPLHFVTLLIVAALQQISLVTTGHHQIYANNDLYHFILNLFFASHWGFDLTYSFNGPIWSVSIEILVYAIFWLTLPFLYRKGVLWPAILTFGCWLLFFYVLRTFHIDLLRCSAYFFGGATLWLLLSAIRPRPTLIAGFALAIVVAGVVIIDFRPRSMPSIGIPLVLTGALLLFCAIEETEHKRHFKRIRWMGDNTYGTYLWHVPIQIGIILMLDRMLDDRSIVLSPWFLLGYCGLVIAIARISFLWIERPAREKLRRL